MVYLFLELEPSLQILRFLSIKDLWFLIKKDEKLHLPYLEIIKTFSHEKDQILMQILNIRKVAFSVKISIYPKQTYIIHLILWTKHIYNLFNFFQSQIVMVRNNYP